MTDDPSPPAAPETERKPLTPAAQRALAEAEARRKAAEANAKPAAKDISGPERPGADPVRRLETKGIGLGFLSARRRLLVRPTHPSLGILSPF